MRFVRRVDLKELEDAYLSVGYKERKARLVAIAQHGSAPSSSAAAGPAPEAAAVETAIVDAPAVETAIVDGGADPTAGALM